MPAARAGGYLARAVAAGPRLARGRRGRPAPGERSRRVSAFRSRMFFRLRTCGGPFIVMKTKATDSRSCRSRRCKVAGVEAGVESRV